MTSKRALIASILQLAVGISAIVAFFIVAFGGGDDIRRWIVTLVLAVIFVVMGSMGIVGYIKSKRR